ALRRDNPRSRGGSVAEILAGKKVLIVDDMASLRVLVSGLLRQAGSETLEASGAEEALRIIAAQPVDAFIVDIQMPGMNGIELCRSIRAMERHRDTPILFITSLDETRALEQAL